MSVYSDIKVDLTFKINFEKRKVYVCKKKNISLVLGANRKICPSGSLGKPRNAKQWPSGRIFLSTHHAHERFLYSSIFLYSNWAATWQNQQNGIRPNWSESLLSAWRNLGSLATHWAQAKSQIRLGGYPGWSESSLGALILLVLSCRGSTGLQWLDSGIFSREFSSKLLQVALLDWQCIIIIQLLNTKANNYHYCPENDSLKFHSSKTFSILQRLVKTAQACMHS